MKREKADPKESESAVDCDPTVEGAKPLEYLNLGRPYVLKREHEECYQPDDSPESIKKIGELERI